MKKNFFEDKTDTGNSGRNFRKSCSFLKTYTKDVKVCKITICNSGRSKMKNGSLTNKHST